MNARDPEAVGEALGQHFDLLAAHARQLVADLQDGKLDEAQRRAALIEEACAREAGDVRAAFRRAKQAAKASRVPIPFRK